MSILLFWKAVIAWPTFILAFDTNFFFGWLFLFWLNSFQLNRSKMHWLFSFQIVKTCCFLFLIFFLSQLLKASNLFCNLHFAKFLQTFLLLLRKHLSILWMRNKEMKNNSFIFISVFVISTMEIIYRVFLLWVHTI